VLGILLIVVVGVELRLLPTGGFTGWSDPAAALRSLVLPAVAL